MCCEVLKKRTYDLVLFILRPNIVEELSKAWNRLGKEVSSIVRADRRSSAKGLVL